MDVLQIISFVSSLAVKLISEDKMIVNQQKL